MQKKSPYGLAGIKYGNWNTVSKLYSYVANTPFHIVWNKIWRDGLSPGIVKNASLFLKRCKSFLKRSEETPLFKLIFKKPEATSKDIQVRMCFIFLINIWEVIEAYTTTEILVGLLSLSLYRKSTTLQSQSILCTLYNTDLLNHPWLMTKENKMYIP